jgi:hypothetical protein
MGIDDESRHPGLCSEVAGGVTRNIVCLFREPDAGNLPVRFDEREQETGSSQTGLRRSCESIPTATGRLKQLRLFSTLLAISNNVGGVKQLSRTLQHALIEERHFALLVGLRFPTWARFESFGSGTRSDPAISSITHCDQDSFSSNSLTDWERDAQSHVQKKAEVLSGRLSPPG